MLLEQRPVKRHSFSIESLAVSSRVENNSSCKRDVQPNTKFNPELTKDINSNLSTPDNHNIVSQIKTPDNSTVIPRERASTPNPDATPQKRRRLDSSSTPPSSSDDSHSDDQLVIDEDMSTGDTEEEKHSPRSSESSEADCEPTENTGLQRKKARTAFSGEQLKQLEGRYRAQKYLTASDRSQLAKTLKLKDQQVKTWFQNRRMKEKRQQREDEQSHGFHLPTGGVDVAQLTALGIACPFPYNQQLGTPSPMTQRFHSPNPSPGPSHSPLNPNGHVISPRTAADLPSKGYVSDMRNPNQFSPGSSMYPGHSSPTFPGLPAMQGIPMYYPPYMPRYPMSYIASPPSTCPTGYPISPPITSPYSMMTHKR